VLIFLKELKEKKDKKPPKRQKPRADAPPFELSRYVPDLKPLVESFVEGKLPTDKFPFVKEGSSPKSEVSDKSGISMRKSDKPRWASDKSKKKSEINTSGPRFIVFIAGGATFSEIRTIYDVAASTKKEILIGATNTLTPAQFVAAMKELQKMEVV